MRGGSVRHRMSGEPSNFLSHRPSRRLRTVPPLGAVVPSMGRRCGVAPPGSRVDRKAR